jgi:hypothetical protein
VWLTRSYWALFHVKHRLVPLVPHGPGGARPACSK